MSRVEWFIVPREVSMGIGKKIETMAAHVGRRQRRRAKLENEVLASNHRPSGGVSKEKPFKDKVKIDVFHWPLASWRKKF